MNVTQKQLAQFFGVSTRTIRRWEADGMPRNPDGTYRTKDCFEWRLTVVAADTLAASMEVPPKAESDARFAAAKAQLAELDLRERAGELVPREEVHRVYGGMLDVLRTNIRNFPGRWAQQVAGELGIEVRPVGAALGRLADELLQDLSGPVADRVQATGVSDDDDS